MWTLQRTRTRAMLDVGCWMCSNLIVPRLWGGLHQPITAAVWSSDDAALTLTRLIIPGMPVQMQVLTILLTCPWARHFIWMLSVQIPPHQYIRYMSRVSQDNQTLTASGQWQEPIKRTDQASVRLQRSWPRAAAVQCKLLLSPMSIGRFLSNVNTVARGDQTCVAQWSGPWTADLLQGSLAALNQISSSVVHLSVFQGYPISNEKCSSTRARRQGHVPQKRRVINHHSEAVGINRREQNDRHSPVTDRNHRPVIQQPKKALYSLSDSYPQRFRENL